MANHNTSSSFLSFVATNRVPLGFASFVLCSLMVSRKTEDGENRKKKKPSSSGTAKPGEGVVEVLAKKHQIPLATAQAIYDAGHAAGSLSAVASAAAPGSGDGAAPTGFAFSSGVSFEKVRNDQAIFAKDREWDQFHLPRNLALALVGEVGELCEIFQWKKDQDCAVGLPGFSEEKHRHVGQELSDCLLYLLRLAEKCHVDLPVAVLEKMALNGAKYPADVVRGSSKKYDAYKNAARGE